MANLRDISRMTVNLTDGWKTYIGSAIVFVAGGLYALKVIDRETFETVVALAGSFALFGVRHAISKVEDTTDKIENSTDKIEDSTTKK